MKITFDQVFNPAIALTRKYGFRILGLYLLILIICFMLSLIPGIGPILQSIASALLGAGLFFGVRKISKLEMTSESSLLDAISDIVFTKDFFIKTLIFQLASLLLFIPGILPMFAVVIFKIAQFSEFSQMQWIETFKANAPLLWIAAFIAILNFLLVYFPAVIFGLYLYLSKIEPSLSQCWKKSLLVFYQNWGLFLKLTLFIWAPLFIGAMVFGLIWFLTRSTPMVVILSGLCLLIYMGCLIPYHLSQKIVLFDVFFDPKEDQKLTNELSLPQ